MSLSWRTSAQHFLVTVHCTLYTVHCLSLYSGCSIVWPSGENWCAIIIISLILLSWQLHAFQANLYWVARQTIKLLTLSFLLICLDHSLFVFYLSCPDWYLQNFSPGVTFSVILHRNYVDRYPRMSLRKFIKTPGSRSVASEKLFFYNYRFFFNYRSIQIITCVCVTLLCRICTDN